MDNVYPALYQKLAADAMLNSYLQDVALGKNPDDPKNLSQPVLVIHPFGGPDINGLHGVALDVQMELKIWGYGNVMYIDAMKAAARASVLLLEGITVPSGNFIGKFRPITGWQDINTADAKMLHLQNQYSARYWSKEKINALTS